MTSSCGDDDDQRLLRCDRLIGTQHTELDHGCLACVRGGQTATAKNLPRRQGAGARRDASKMRRRRCSYVGLRHWLCLSNTSRTGPNRPSYQRAVGFYFLFFLKSFFSIFLFFKMFFTKIYSWFHNLQFYKSTARQTAARRPMPPPCRVVGTYM